MKRTYNVTYREAHQWASSFLKTAGKEEDIAYHFLLGCQKWTVTDWYLKCHQDMPKEEWEFYQAGIQRIVEEDYPYQYILGESYFYGRPFYVNESVLIPRFDTELLIDQVKHSLKEGQLSPSARVVDIGTGSGILAITLALECPTLKVTATDLSKEALQVAQENAERLGAKLTFRSGDLYAPLEGEKFDLILSNPPYIAHGEEGEMGVDVLKYEPPMALFAEEEGYAIYKRLAKDLASFLNPGGLLMVECGFKQAQKVAKIFQKSVKASSIRIIKDYNGINRVIYLKQGDDGASCQPNVTKSMN